MISLPFLNEKYKVIFVKNINGTNTVVGTKKIKTNDRTVRYNKRDYPLDTGKPTYRRNLTNYYFIDVGGMQISFSEGRDLSEILDTIDTINTRNVVAQLAGQLSGKGLGSTVLGIAILCIAVGILGGYFAGNLFPLQGISEGLKNFSWSNLKFW